MEKIQLIMFIPVLATRPQAPDTETGQGFTPSKMYQQKCVKGTGLRTVRKEVQQGITGVSSGNAFLLLLLLFKRVTHPHSYCRNRNLLQLQYSGMKYTLKQRLNDL